MSKYLYRALNNTEIKKGNLLIPKQQDTFSKWQHFPLTFPLLFDRSEINGISNHIAGQATSGVSTTKNILIAVYYSLAKKNSYQQKVIVQIDRNKLQKHKIKELDVNQIELEKFDKQKDLTQKTGDEEVILVNESFEKFPQDIIIKVIEFKDYKYISHNFESSKFS